MQSGGQGHKWTSAYVLVQLLVGLGIIGLLLVWESQEIVKPLIPFRLFRGQRVVGLALGIGAMGGIAYYVVLNLGPTIIQTAFHKSPVGYGLLALGPGLGLTFGAVGSNVLLSIIGHRAREVLAVGAIIMSMLLHLVIRLVSMLTYICPAAFTGAEAVINPNNSTAFAIISSFSAFGVGAVIIPVTTVVTLAWYVELRALQLTFALTKSVVQKI